MKPIELEIWRPREDDPRYAECIGTRTAVEVFKELEQRLDSMGMLPDEYFLLDSAWENGRLIPKDADIFVTTDYGGSEGIYLDAYLKWYEDGKPVTKSFFTGKTLGETGTDLDRMFLISSTITKAFHGYGRQPDNGMVLCLNAEEKKEIIEALVEKRERTIHRVDHIEKLLRHTMGSITAYMDTVGERPLRISDFDKAMLTIRDGELTAFKELLPKVIDRGEELLVETAGRAGAVGSKMVICLLAGAEKLTDTVYLTASKRAVDVGDTERVKFLMEQYQGHVTEPNAGYYGDVIRYAIGENRQMARTLLEQSPDSWIAAATPDLLYYATIHPSENFHLIEGLVKKGAPCGERAWEILNRLTSSGNTWMAETLLRDGLKVSAKDYGAFDVCVKNGAMECAKKLLAQGVDFDQYTEWALGHPYSATDEKSLAELREYWQAIQSQEQAAADVPKHELTFGGLSQ